jgi:transcriptional regulator EpsA
MPETSDHPTTPVDIHHYHRVISQAVRVRTHFDLLIWLQGEMQFYLPHDIMIAAWGDFQDGKLRFDVISPMAGVRTHSANVETLTPLVFQLYQRWTDFKKRPYAMKVGDNGFFLEDTGLPCLLGTALKGMRSAMVHGINDVRHGVECLYVTFSIREDYSRDDRATVGTILPYIDAALRQVSHLPDQPTTPAPLEVSALTSCLQPGHNLSTREAEIMFWVAMGKTNPEMGCILNISEFTVKNHMQRVFKKLDVSNRAQAVSKFRELGA